MLGPDVGVSRGTVAASEPFRHQDGEDEADRRCDRDNSDRSAKDGVEQTFVRDFPLTSTSLSAQADHPPE